MLDLNKPITTRDGRSVRIICTDRLGDKPLVALIPSHHGNEEFASYFYKDGGWTQNHENHTDLINPKVKKEGWINIYGKSERSDDIYPSECIAKECSMFSCITTIKIEWEE